MVRLYTIKSYVTCTHLTLNERGHNIGHNLERKVGKIKCKKAISMSKNELDLNLRHVHFGSYTYLYNLRTF